MRIVTNIEVPGSRDLNGKKYFRILFEFTTIKKPHVKSSLEIDVEVDLWLKILRNARERCQMYSWNHVRQEIYAAAITGEAEFPLIAQ